MPTYDYRCLGCDHIFESFHGINESPQLACPECGSQETSKQISGGAGIHFKGSGFYVNDYKKGADAPKADAPKKEGASKEKKVREAASSQNNTAQTNSQTKASS